ncbi:MAG: hypothetical protein LBJ67_05905 [Planctomycetaceae bacterium]|jgi:hypothetical protein|nr:hypothetical protein [Planctomycetaceae bacterium]
MSKIQTLGKISYSERSEIQTLGKIRYLEKIQLVPLRKRCAAFYGTSVLLGAETLLHK